MKANFSRSALILLLILILTLTAGCGTPIGEESIDEDELTLQFLKEDYASQLLTDGAEHLVGSIELTSDSSGSPQIILHPKEPASKANEDGTYTVSSYSINRVLSLSDSLYSSVDGETILSGPDFVTAISPEFDDNIMYDVYALDDQALLILYNPVYVLPSES